MMAGNFYTEQAKKHYVPKIGSIGMVIFTVLWVILSLFTFHCTGVEAAVPKPEEISGEYHYYAHRIYADSGRPKSGNQKIIFRGNTLYWYPDGGTSVRLSYNAQSGTARGFYRDKHKQTNTLNIRFHKESDGDLYASGTLTFTYYSSGKPHTDWYSVEAKKIRSIVAAPSGEKKTDKESGEKNQNAGNNKQNAGNKKQNVGQKNPNSQKEQKQKQVAESKKDAERNVVPGVGSDGAQDDGRDIDEEERDRNDLPPSDAGKTAAAVGTALAGAMAGAVGAVGGALGGAAGGAAGGAVGGALGGAAGGATGGTAGGAAGSAGGAYDGFGLDEGGNDLGSGEDYDESGEDQDEFGEGQDGSGEDYDESGEDYDESGEDQDESGEDQDESDEEQDEPDEDQDESDEEQDESDEDQGESDEDQNESDEEQDESDENQDESDKDDDESDEDREDAGDNPDNNGDADNTGEEQGGEVPGEVGEEPETRVYKDPATGAETLYVRDPETGEWYDPSTNSIMNPDDLERFNKQRMEDQKWTRDQMDKLRNRTTQTDRLLQDEQEKLKQELKQKYDEIDRQGAKDKAAIRSGTYGMSDEQRKEYLNKRQENYVTKQTAAHRTADNWDTAVKVAEGVETAADIGVDVLSKITAPVGGEAIADAYVMTKNVVKSTSEAVAEGKNVLIGIRKGLGDGAIDVAQNHAKGVGQVLANVGGEAIKGGVEAAWKGESITQGAFEGSLKGTVKLGIERVGDAISNKLNNSVKDSWQKAKDHAETITNSYSPHISRKSTDALHKMNLDKYTDYLKKAGKLENANTIGNAVIKNTLPDAFDDDD